ncbi:MAG: mechanosensitive ion channel protein MscS, partial [Proteobacteria bacterium]|nr:mechanosensitive ion channel protein MscS [Pseudomonadota bacterium]
MTFQLFDYSSYLNFNTLIELAIAVSSIALSYFFVADTLRRFVSKNSKAKNKVITEGLIKVIFPICAIVMIGFAQTISTIFFSHGLLVLVQKLLIALVVIRLSVYLMRYLSKPNSILRAFENTVSFVIWVVLALQITGVLPEFINS